MLTTRAANVIELSSRSARLAPNRSEIEHPCRIGFVILKQAEERRLEGVERENLTPPAGLRASHAWMGDVSTIPEAGRQNPGSDNTPSSFASLDFSSTRST
jgi:hypothetical protein